MPLLKALLGPQYSSLGVVAGISSFIFQLPLMLILFEASCDRAGMPAALAAPAPGIACMKRARSDCHSACSPPAMHERQHCSALCPCNPLHPPLQVHVWRQEVLHGTLPETQPNPATTGGSAPLLTDCSGEHKEEGKGSRCGSPDGQQVSD